ncbi:Bcr/CflA family efflux MFS transporter [Flavobacteriaceae bacterium R38]|nr:Bcr/CflA family efflux MFS transporter [Flavobacteriaceae bacterium R38]
MQKTKQSQFEFIALMASLMSIVALALDALLPALDIIGLSIGTTRNTDNQLLITMFFLGLGVGPMLFGPISDSLGRKPMVYLGFVIFTITSFICVYAKSLEVMIIGRILQGIGLSAPRTIAIAIIRDKFSGDYMARIMSFVTVVFLLIPVIAPALGKLTLDHYNWQGIFYIQMIIGIIVWIWFWKRQPETLSDTNRKPFSRKVIINGFAEIFKHRTTMGYTFISGLIVGSFLVYLSSSQQIFQEQYQLKNEFPYIFAGLAIALGAAIFSNGSLVIKFGMKKLVTIALISYFISSLIYVILFKENPSVEILITFFALQFFAIGFLFGNLRALAMEPVGHIAGIGAAITGLISTLMAVAISTYIGRFITSSSFPIFAGFLICSGISLITLFVLNKSKIKTDLN